MTVLIKGGRIVTAADDYVADVLVDGERISLIGADLDVSADRTIDASGRYILPGCVDPHTHLDMPFGGTVTIDDFESGQGSAACGGTTCHVDFCIQGKGQTFAEALEGWHAKANGKSIIDYGFHIAITDLGDEERLEELATLPEQGITSYKLFMAYKNVLQVDDETLFRAMEVAAASGALVMVHAENGDAIDVLVREALARGDTAPVHHARTRPPELEGEATNRAIQLARIAGSPLYVVHVTCREAVEPIRRARDLGWNVWGRRARSTSSGRLTTSPSPDSRARSTSTPLRPATPRTTTCCGTRCAPTRSPRSRPITARSSGTDRRHSVRTTSPRSRTAGQDSRIG